MKKTLRVLIIADYYLAALLLVWAGIAKLLAAGVGDLLTLLFDEHLITIEQLVFISRWYPPLEIAIGLIALTGVRALFTARLMGCIYLIFSLLIYHAAGGYLLYPLDCGCFGEGGVGTPAYLLLLRNMIIALPLFFLPSSPAVPLFLGLSDRNRQSGPPDPSP